MLRQFHVEAQGEEIAERPNKINKGIQELVNKKGTTIEN